MAHGHFILDPEKNEDSVQIFRDYFRLSRPEATPDFLEEVLSAFSVLPYENISKIIKLNRHFNEDDKRIRLPEEVISDHISKKLGGTCFALTYFLQSILVQTGFKTYPVMADMRAGENIHTANIVLWKGRKFLIDPGYLLNHPMEIHSKRPRVYKTEFTGVELRFDPATDYYHLYTFDREEVRWRYRFKDQPVSWDAFFQYWQESFFKPGMHGINLTRLTPDGLIFVHNDFMRETSFSGKRNIKIKKNYHEAISRVFGIDKQIIEQAQAALSENLRLERDYGIFKPRKETHETR
ncbi:MAG: arylamine N-acetyltransferase [Calditrichaeota bacterium]|nr:arylamine N-acetyltransferase [Calditrichota bacterium]